MIRDPRSAGNAPLILALIVAGIMLVLNRAHAAELELYTSHGWQEEYAARKPGMTYWPENIVLEYPAGWRSLAESVAWKWSQRIGKTITTRPATGEGHWSSGVITINASKTTAQIQQMTQSQTTAALSYRWSSMETGFIIGAIVFMPSDTEYCREHALLHEVGHAIGITGHEGARPTDVMHSTQDHCLPALTVQDVSMAPYSDHACHGEVLADGSVYLPAVEGWGVHLVPRGDAWGVARAVESGAVCVGAQLTGDRLLLSDIRSPAGRWMGELRQDGDVWRVIWAAPVAW